MDGQLARAGVVVGVVVVIGTRGRTRRHEDVDGDAVGVIARGQGRDKWVRAFGRREVQDGERDVARELDEEGAPLDGEGEPEEGAEGAQVRVHGCVRAAELRHCLAVALGVVERSEVVMFDMRWIIV